MPPKVPRSYKPVVLVVPGGSREGSSPDWHMAELVFEYVSLDRITIRKGRYLSHGNYVHEETAFQEMKAALEQQEKKPIPMRLHCPECGELHIDKGDFATKVHHTHACQYCGGVWRPAVVPTVGVRFLPGFKNENQGDAKE